jgi:hypothetical protein
MTKSKRNISEKLQDIVTDIKERGHANLTRLTVLKKWFEAPGARKRAGAALASVGRESLRAGRGSPPSSRHRCA